MHQPAENLQDLTSRIMMFKETFASKISDTREGAVTTWKTGGLILDMYWANPWQTSTYPWHQIASKSKMFKNKSGGTPDVPSVSMWIFGLTVFCWFIPTNAKKCPGPHLCYPATCTWKERGSLQMLISYQNPHKEIPSRELTYPTLGKGKSSSKCHFWGIC